MTGHLARLAARATEPAGSGLRPRLPSLFEPPAGLRPGDAGSALAGANEARPGATAAGAARAGLAGSDPARPGLPGPDLPGPDLAGSDLPGPDPAPRGRARGAPVRRALARPPHGSEPFGEADDAGTAGAGPPATGAASRAAPSGAPTPRTRARTTLRTGQSDGAAPSREEHAPGGLRARTTDPTTDARPSAGTPPAEATGSPAALPGSSVRASEQVVATLVAEALAGGLRPAAAGRDATTYDGTAPPRDGVPPTEAAGPGAAPLPRLHTGRSSEPGRRDRRPATPEVTVNIGRIEVVPPPPEPRPAAPRPRPPARASGAPALADYLRDRSRR